MFKLEAQTVVSEQLYLRRCRKHQMNLAEAIDELICPYPPPDGHVCDDFVVIDRKTGAVVNETPQDEEAAPKARPAGSADVTRTLGRSVSKKEQPMQRSNEEKVQAKRKRGETWPHGTPQRYYQEAKAGTGTCEPCRKAASKYAREKRALRLANAGGAQTARPRTKTTAVQKSTASAERTAKVLRPVLVGEVVPADQVRLGILAKDIVNTRARLVELEADFAREANALVGSSWQLVPAAQLDLAKAIGDSRRARA